MRRALTASSFVRRLAPGVLFIGAILAVLQWLVQAGHIRRALFPPPSVVGAAVWRLLVNGGFAEPLAETLGLLFLGFAIAVVLGIGIGLLIGVSRVFFDLLEPLIEVLRPMPKSALLPALMLFLGLGLLMKVTAVALACFFPVLINTVQGVRGVDPTMIDTGRTFGLSLWTMTRKVILPASLPYILAGMRVSLGLALLVTTLAEMLAGGGGIGFLILDNERAFRVTQMYAWLVVLAAVGLTLNYAIAAAERRLAPWLRPAGDGH